MVQQTMKLSIGEQYLRYNGRRIDAAVIAEIHAAGGCEGTSAEADLYRFLHEWFSPSETLTVHTSGSTGKPKALEVSKRRMMESARMTCEHLSLGETDTALLCMNLKYIGAMMMVVRSLVAGMELFLRPASGHPFSDVRERVTFVAMVPLQLYNTLQNDTERSRLDRTEKVIIGGGAVDDALQQMTAGLHCAVYSTYGMTETLSHIALRPLNGTSAGECYTPFKGITLSQDEDGALIINAPALTLHPLHTNDIVRLHSDQSFSVVGRKDNVINSGGVKIHIEEVERLLKGMLSTPFAVTSIPDPRLGEAVTLLLTECRDIQELHRQMETVLPPYWCPKHIFVVGNIPMTENGKIDRASCRSLAREKGKIIPTPQNLEERK